jgi:hypothetical protein
MLATNLFMLVWGIKLFRQLGTEHPDFRSSVLACPICRSLGGALTALLVIERFMTQKFFAEPEAETVSGLTTE